jgi:hypothetical protein
LEATLESERCAKESDVEPRRGFRMRSNDDEQGRLRERAHSMVVWGLVIANLAFVGLFVYLAYEKPHFAVLWYILTAAGWLYFAYIFSKSRYAHFIDRR